MLITNGKTTRNIAEKQLNEYKLKGYKVVEETPKKTVKKGDK